MHTFSHDRLPSELENWLKQPVMRSLDSASIRQNRVARGVISTSIRHRELAGINSEMVYQWFKYFCYQNLRLANGKEISAFRLWHPQDHISFEIQKHSLSGEVGLAKGASALVIEKRGDKVLCSGEVKIIDLSNKRISIKHKSLLHHHNLVSDEFFDTKRGLQMISNLVNVEGRFQHDADRSADSEISLEIQAWIEHKIEEVGNLQIILPSLIRNSCLNLSQVIFR